MRGAGEGPQQAWPGAASPTARRGVQVHLICTGSLTNAALMLILWPEVRAALAGITIMGGCLGVGNMHPVAEFNMMVRVPPSSRRSCSLA